MTDKFFHSFFFKISIFFENLKIPISSLPWCSISCSCSDGCCRSRVRCSRSRFSNPNWATPRYWFLYSSVWKNRASWKTRNFYMSLQTQRGKKFEKKNSKISKKKSKFSKKSNIYFSIINCKKWNTLPVLNLNFAGQCHPLNSRSRRRKM